MESFDIDCPYCGEIINILVDGTSTEEQEYYEDCSVCCYPILFISTLDEFNNISLFAKTDDE